MISLALAILTALAPAAGQQADEPQRLALMIGISDYPETEAYQDFPPLNGCENDLQLLSNVLVERFGFAGVGEDIRWLLNEEATHQNVVQAVSALIDKAGSNTEVLIYFSGHGSRLPDSSGAAGVELDGKDSTFVVFDAREKSTPFDLTDDELFSLLQALCAKTAHVTLITDCCHSGGVARGDSRSSSRLAPEADAAFDPATVEAFWPDGVVLMDDGDRRRRKDLPFVHLAACAADEVAREIHFEQLDHTYGVLTYYLVDELQRMVPGTTFEQLAAKLKLRVADEVWDQTVHLDGAVDRIVFGGEFAQPMPGFAAVAEWREDGYIEVEAGGLHLLSENSELLIQSLQGESLGTASVWELEAMSCTAKWTSAPDFEADSNGEAKADEVRAVRAVARPTWQSHSLNVQVQGASSQELVSKLQAQAGEQFQFTLTADEHTACKLSLIEQSGKYLWQLRSIDDQQLLWSASAEDFENQLPALLQALEREQLFRSIMSMSRVGGGIELKMELQPASEKTLKELRQAWPDGNFAAVQPRTQSDSLSNQQRAPSHFVDQGEELIDVAEINLGFADQERGLGAYVSVLCLSSNRTISVIYPTDLARENMLEPNESLRIPIEVFFPENYDPKHGVRDRYFAIATASWADFSIFERLEALQSQSTHRGNLSDGMPDALKQAMAGRTLRGAGSLSADDWSFGISAIDVRVFSAQRP